MKNFKPTKRKIIYLKDMDNKSDNKVGLKKMFEKIILL